MRSRLPHWVERHPLIWIALSLLGAILFADGLRGAGTAVMLAALGTMAIVRAWRLAGMALALAVLAGALHARRIDSQRASLRALEKAPVAAELTGVVEGDARASGQGWSAMVRVSDGDADGRRIWWRGVGPAPLNGETISARGSLTGFPPARNPGEFDFADWVFRKGAAGCFESSGLSRRVGESPAWKRSGLGVRAAFRDAITTGLDPLSREAMVIRAMVLGEHPADDVLMGPFRNSGTLHAFSVSGLHVGMLGLLGWWLLRLLGTPRFWAVPGIVALMLAYCWLTGMQAPALRSVTMAAVLLGAFLIRRRPDLLNALGFAFIAAVLVDGNLVFQAGVQLSFGVVAAIGFMTPALLPLVSRLKRRELYLPRSLYGPWRSLRLRSRVWLADSLAVSGAAALGSTPLTIWHFGLLSPISILASTVLCPLVFAVMALAFAAGLLAPLPGVSKAVNRLNFWFARGCIRVAELGSAVPGGHFQLPRDRPAGDFLVVYDPGQGGGAAVLYEQGHAVLFDSGSHFSFERTVLPSLRHYALEPVSMVLSHPDAGHLGGTVAACDAFPIERILSPVMKARSASFREIGAVTASRGIPLICGATDRVYRISPDAWLEVLHAPDPWNQNAVADERVMVTRLHWRGHRILFAADAGLSLERAMLESGRDLSAEVIVMGRHRNDSSAGDAFLAAVKPQAIVAGHADFPSAERVPPGWERACRARGIQVMNQSRTGAVTLVPREDGALELRGFLDGSVVTVRPQAGTD